MSRAEDRAKKAGPSESSGQAGIGHPRLDARSLAMARIIVERIDEDPTLIEVAHRNLVREERHRGELSKASGEWKELLSRPWAQVRQILLDESEEGQRLRSSRAFAGIVTEEKRLAIVERYPPPWPFMPYDPSQVPKEVMARIIEDGP